MATSQSHGESTFDVPDMFFPSLSPRGATENGIEARAERLANDPDARFPDEEPEQAENKADGAACQMMTMLEDHQEALGSQLYVNLANLTGQFAKLERRAARMKKKLIEYDGSDCSALIPSDEGEEVDHEEGFFSDDDDNSEASLDSDNLSNSKASTASSDAGDKIPEENRRKSNELSASGYYIKHMGAYYAVPKKAIPRHYNRPIEVPTAKALRERTVRGGRASAWRWEPVHPSTIVVLHMKNRVFGTDEFAWAVILNSSDTSVDAAADDHKIFHLLPFVTVLRLIRSLEADDLFKGSSLLTKYKPSWVDVESPHGRPAPIPGPSLKQITGGVNHGCYWPSVASNKRVRSATDLPLEDSSSDEEFFPRPTWRRRTVAPAE